MDANVIVNPASGNQAESALQLVELLRHLQKQRIQAQVLIVEPEMRLSLLARRAALDGTKMVIVSGGDGTIENVAVGLAGTTTILGIVPTGTRNNLARSLGIPTGDIGAAVALFQKGRRARIDMGLLRQGRSGRMFMEAGAIGLVSALYPSADDIQHGDIGKIPEFISTFVSHAPSEIRLRLDHHRHEIITRGHMVLVANMPYMGANFQIGPDVRYDDHRLDVFVYSELGKLDLIGKAIQPQDSAPDERIQHYRVKKVSISTNPGMPVMADGVMFPEGDGPVTASVQSSSLTVMVGSVAVPVSSPPSSAPQAAERPNVEGAEIK